MTRIGVKIRNEQQRKFDNLMLKTSASTFHIYAGRVRKDKQGEQLMRNQGVQQTGELGSKKVNFPADFLIFLDREDFSRSVQQGV